MTRTKHILGIFTYLASSVESVTSSTTLHKSATPVRESYLPEEKNDQGLAHFTMIAAATVLVLTIGVAVGWRVLQNPFNQSPYDQVWATVYAGVSATILVLLAPWQGRLVTPITLIISIGLVGYMVVIGGFTVVVLVWLLLVITTGLIGNSALKLILKDLPLRKLERAVLSSSLGFIIVSLVVFLAGIAGVLYSAVTWAALVIGTLILAPEYLRLARVAGSLMKKQIRKRPDGAMPRLVGVLIAPCLVAFVGSFPWILAPETQYDALNYQLAIPAIYAREHRLLEVPYTFWSYIVGTTGQLYVMGLLLFGQPLPHLLHLGFGLVLCAATFSMARDIFNSRVGLVAAALLFTTPLFSWEYGTAYIDLIVSAYWAISLLCILKWDSLTNQGPDDSANTRWVILAGLMAGFSVATKLNAAVFLIPSTLFLVFRLLALKLSVTQKLNVLLLAYALPALLVAAPWFVLRMSWTGNPVFPFMNALFGTRSSSDNASSFLSLFGLGTSLPAIIQLPWVLSTRTDLFGEGPNGIIGAISLMSLPLFAIFDRARLSRNSVSITLIAFLGFLSWAFTAQYVRYMLPIIPIMTILAGANVDILLRIMQQGRSALMSATMVLITVLWLAYFVAGRVIYTVWNWNLPERVPLTIALGKETPEQFLSRTVTVYDALQFINRRASPHSRVFSAGNEFRLYSSADIVGLLGSRDARAMMLQGPDSELAESLDREGFDWLLVNRGPVRADEGLSALPVLDPEFLRQFATLEFSQKGIEIYRLVPQGVTNTEFDGVNLLSNAGFEELDAAGRPAGWAAYGNPVVDTSGPMAHEGQNAARADASSGFTFTRPVEPGSLYTLGHWTRADQDGQFARLQVNWLGVNGQILAASIEVVPVTREWTYHEFSATVPNRTTLANVYVSVHETSTVWFDDVRFIQRN
jgi:hypothetical protein